MKIHRGQVMKPTKFFACILTVILAVCFIGCGTDAEDGSSPSANASGTTETTESTDTSGDSGSTGKTDAPGDTGGTDAAGTTEDAAVPEDAAVIYLNLTDSKVSVDNTAWSDITTTKTKLLDNTVVINFTKDEDKNSTGLIKIDATSVTKAFSVNVTGTMTTGGIKIQSNGTNDVWVTLNGATIASSNYPCLEVTKGSPAKIILTGKNAFTDGRTYGTGYGEEYSLTEGATYTDDGETKTCEVSQTVVSEGSDSKGTLYSKGNLSINGSGSLSVIQAYKNCIASKDGTLTINGGTLTLQNYISDSTKSSATGKNGLYGGQNLVINGGAITFNGYGIITKSSSGIYDFRKANALKTDDDDYPESAITINGGVINATTYNGKGINAPYVYIKGGTTTLNVTGVTTYANYDDNAPTGYCYDADGVKTSMTAKFSAEGIEGDLGVTISGGKTIVSATDDGVNVSATGGTLSISDGFLYVKTKGDGLDSNGNITISGGITVVSQTGGGNAPIDCGDSGYKFTVTGTSATVLALGSSDMFSESIPSSTVSPMIYSTSLGSSSSSLGVNGIIAVKSPQTYAAALLVSPSLTSGSSYSFVKNGTISGTEYVSGSGVYFPATVSGGTSTSATATTQGGSTGGNQPGGNQPGFPGGRW